MTCISVVVKYLVNGKFDISKYDQNKIEGSMRGFLLPDQEAKNHETDAESLREDSSSSNNKFHC